MNKILMVDDDPAVNNDNRQYFEAMGYEVLCAENASKAQTIISACALDCIILDIGLPDASGFDLCTQIRNTTPRIPVVFLSGYTEEHNRIRGLLIGGDDYVCKPYSLQELELRVRARIQSRRAAEPPKPLHFGSLSIVPADHTITYGSSYANLSAYEFDLLYFLACHPRQIFTYEQIYDQVWQAPVNKGIKSLQMTIVRIRQKLMQVCPEHEYIQTIRRKGYLFVP